jgi:hypothetical protein
MNPQPIVSLRCGMTFAHQPMQNQMNAMLARVSKVAGSALFSVSGR